MSLTAQLGYPEVPKSVTNPNVKKNDALDVGTPMSFLLFTNTVAVKFEPSVLRSYYEYYINKWNQKKTSTQNDSTNEIQLRYKNFLKELVLNHTTIEEKEFLSKLDYDDPLDIDASAVFFTKKIKELANTYNKKRHDILYDSTRNKLIGTTWGVEKHILELTLSHLKNFKDGNLIYDFDIIKQKLEIEIEELFDTYVYYYNVVPDSTVFDYKDLDYGLDLFIQTNSEILSTSFSAIPPDIQQLKELDDLLDNKRKLTQKSVFTDFYFLSTGPTTEFVSGFLFKSSEDMGVFRNKTYPTTASTRHPRQTIKTPLEVGFFKPTKTSIILMDDTNDTFRINTDALKPNTLYYFADPTVFGGSDIITFIFDDNHIRKNQTSGKAANQPKSTPSDTKYYGYVTETHPNSNRDLSQIFDKGIVVDTKRDVYGNMFGLFKNPTTTPPTSSTSTNIPTGVRYLIIDGYRFYDDMYMEGLNFDFSTVDNTTYTELERSGKYTNTGTFLDQAEETILFGSFDYNQPFLLPSDPELINTFEILDNVYISREPGEYYPSTYSTDLSAYEDGGYYYFSTLLECGTHLDYPYIRPLVDPLYPSISANMTLDPRLSADVYDGGILGQVYDFTIIPKPTGYQLIETTTNKTEYLPVSSTPPTFDGTIIVRNSASKSLDPITIALPYLSSRFSPDIITDIENHTIEMELANSSICIKTSKYFIIDSLSFKNDKFVTPPAPPIHHTHSNNWANAITNRIQVDNQIYYGILQTTTPSISSTMTIYPTIYSYDTLNGNYALLYSGVDDPYMESGVIYGSINGATFTHSKRNNIYKISFIVDDINGCPTLHEYNFTPFPTVVPISHTVIPIINGSSIVGNDTTSTMTPYMSSNTLMISTTETETII